MKLTEENKYKVRMSKKGMFIYKNISHIYGGICKECGEPFIIQKGNVKDVNSCSFSCCRIGRDNPMYGKSGKDSPNFGRKRSKETLDKQSEAQKGNKGSGWKGGVTKLNIPLYDTYAHQLTQFNFEEVQVFYITIGDVIHKSLKVRCHESGCRKWFMPKRTDVRHKLQAFNGTISGQNEFYCSSECKTNCCTFYQKRYPKGHKDIIRTYSTTELKTWAREVLKRNNFICACCGEPATIGHHKKSKIESPELALDPNNGISLCDKCHMPIFHKGDNHPSHYVDKCRDLKKPDKI